MPPQENPASSANHHAVFVSPDVLQLPPQGNKRKKYMFGAIAGILFIFIVGGVVFGLSGKHPVKAKSATKKSTVLQQSNNSPSAVTKPVVKTPASSSTSSAQAAPTHSSSSGAISSVNVPPSAYQGSLPSTLGVNTVDGDSYYYAGDRQYANAAGASVVLGQYSPSVTQTAGSKNHSLMEISAESSNGQQIVELGWTVDPSINGDNSPHLFVFYWVNGQQSPCYNTCGFVSTNNSIGPGSAVAVGSSGTYSIAYSGSAWYLSYDGNQLGYFPESLWGGNYTQMNFVSIFGEVELSGGTTTQCVQMGNGIPGSSPGSAVISNFSLIDSTTAPALSPYVTTPSSYSYGNASATGLDIGGPGSC